MVQPSEIVRRDPLSFSLPELREHEPIKNVPVQSCRAGLALGLDVPCEKKIRDLPKGGGALPCRPLCRWVASVRDRSGQSACKGNSRSLKSNRIARLFL